MSARISKTAQIAMALALAAPLFGAMPARAAPATLCFAAMEPLDGDRKLAAAVRDAIGDDFAYGTRDRVTGCVYPLQLLSFEGVDVLVTAGNVPGELSHGEGSNLSAYFLRREGGTSRLVTVKRDFAVVGGGYGRPGGLVEARFEGDDALLVKSSGSGQGYTYDWIEIFAFRNGGIVQIGRINTGFRDDGAQTDESKITVIEGSADIAEPEPDNVRVTYTVTRGGKTSTQTAIWRHSGGKFVVASGDVPSEIERN